MENLPSRKIFPVGLNPVEEAMLMALVEKKGFRKSEVFRLGIRMMYRKEFPISSLTKRKSPMQPKDSMADLSPEEKCLTDGGEIVIEDGIKKCKIVRGKLEYSYVLR